jgi:hypothetical protein
MVCFKQNHGRYHLFSIGIVLIVLWLLHFPPRSTKTHCLIKLELSEH